MKTLRTLTYNAETVRKWIDALAAADYVGTGSMFTQQGTPNCSLGHIAKSEGITFAQAFNVMNYTEVFKGIPEHILVAIYSRNDHYSYKSSIDRKAGVMELLNSEMASLAAIERLAQAAK